MVVSVLETQNAPGLLWSVMHCTWLVQPHEADGVGTPHSGGPPPSGWKQRPPLPQAVMLPRQASTPSGQVRLPPQGIAQLFFPPSIMQMLSAGQSAQSVTVRLVAL